MMTQKQLFITVMTTIIALITGLAINPVVTGKVILCAGLLAALGLMIFLIWTLCGLYAWRK